LSSPGQARIRADFTGANGGCCSGNGVPPHEMAALPILIGGGLGPCTHPWSRSDVRAVVKQDAGARAASGGRKSSPRALLYSRFSLIPQLPTDILPLVGSGGSMLVESRKNGQIFRGIIWWDQPGSPAHPPTRPRPPHPARRPAPSAAATPRRTAELHSPPARSVSLPQVNGQKTNKNGL
jgi:hypothetical protein